MQQQTITNWTTATGEMPWGVQSAFMTALQAVESGDIKMVHGTDSYNGSPCLVNSINQMISPGANAIPSAFAGKVVGAFDDMCRTMYEDYPHLADFRIVTPFMADLLIHHFGPINEQPEIVVPEVNVMDAPYTEPTDSDMIQEWLSAQVTECPVEDKPVISDQDVADVEHYLNAE